MRMSTVAPLRNSKRAAQCQRMIVFVNVLHFE
jgi:hypothetical protein